jgi:hypothetical protein
MTPSVEICDKLDNDCNGAIDEGENAPKCTFYYYDNDDDGFAVEGASKKCLCAPNGKYSAKNTGNCNDSDKQLYPGGSTYKTYFTFWAWIDGSDFVHIKGNSVWYVHENFEKPGLHAAKPCSGPCPTKINGQEWYPTWSGKISDTYQGLNPPQPNAPINVKLMIIKSRGKTQIKQMPTASNNFETIVYLDDVSIGSSIDYEFQLSYQCGSP